MISYENILLNVEKWLSEIDCAHEPRNLYEPIDYSLSLGGKRLRPVLCLSACSLFRDDYESARWCALAIEVFHNFTLLHDDVMDKAGIRRGKPTVVAKYGLNTAILSGDAMLIEAYRLLSLTDSPSYPLVCDVFSQTAMQVCEGQQYDMDFENRTDVSTEEYLNMIRLKTAVLLAASLKMGALIGGASLCDVEALYEYGIQLGIAFQIQDDLLDTFGDEKTFGKTIGGDIMSNKKTFLLTTALERATTEQRLELASWLSLTDPVREEKIEGVRNLFIATRAREVAQAKIESLYSKAMNDLRAMDITAEGKRMFIDSAEKLFHRTK